MGLLGKRLIYFSRRFCKSWIKWENPCLWIIKKFSAFFVNISSGFSSSWTSFHRYHPASWIFVIIHVEKTFRAQAGEICGNNFKKTLKITKHIEKQHERFLIPRQRYKHFRYFWQKGKVYLIGQFPSSPTYSVKNFGSTALHRWTDLVSPLCGIFVLLLLFCINFLEGFVWRKIL